MGKGSSSGSSSAVVTPEQTQQNQLTNQLLASYIPVIQKTLSGASTAYGEVAPAVQNSATNVINNAANVQGGSNAVGANALGKANDWSNYATITGAQGGQGLANTAGTQSQFGTQGTTFGANQLAGLFSPQYEASQVKASLEPAMEAAREASGGQTAMFGGAGQAGSSREALANANLNSLNQQRFQNAAATTQAAIEGQRQTAASTLLGAGQGALQNAGNLYGTLQSNAINTGNVANSATQTGLGALQQGVNASTTGLTASSAPLGAFNQYASTIFGVPSGTTTGNFTGTQGQNTSSKGKGLNLK